MDLTGLGTGLPQQGDAGSNEIEIPWQQGQAGTRCAVSLILYGTMERLQKIIAHAGICSRRKAEEYIAAGRVTIDGQPVTQAGLKVDPEQVAISVDGKPLREEKKVYILLHKPRGYVTTLSDPQGRPIVTDLLPEIKERLFPVGRLDLDSEGALLLTNDGDLANRVLHPLSLIHI